MASAFDIPDSTDWLNTPLASLSTLENALHCEICKEFYDTPMITSCSHTFCSKCIRTALSTDGRCPSCRTQDQASKLRNNLALQEVVVRFLDARPMALEVARREKESEDAEDGRRKRGKRKRTAALDSDDIVQSQEDERTTRSKSRRLAVSQTSEPELIEVIDSENDSDFSPVQEANDGLVECLLGCGKRMKIEAVDPHLDKCEEEQKAAASRSKSRTPVNLFPSSSSRPPSSKPPERISELNYSLLTDAKLRAKLRELGLPNAGSKQLMIRRHTEWVNLWNANCDSQNPRSERELLRELDQWERTQGGRAPNPNGLASTVMRKDFDSTAWTNRNKDDFSRLIAEAKRRKGNPANEPERPKAEEAAQVAAVEADGETNDSAQQPSNGLDPKRPYENNPEAMASIREKVAAANAGQPIEPVMNAGFTTSTNGQTPPSPQVPRQSPVKANLAPPGTENPALLEKSHFGLSNGATGLDMRSPKCDLGPSPAKKVPMFAVPQQPFSDVDGTGEEMGGH